MQRSNQVWTKVEVKLLVGWMEEHEDLLQGKKHIWHQEVHIQVFSDYEHITVKKIKEKANNMKRSWQAARAMADNSGWGVENQDESIQEVLERKCPFYARLDRLWGSHPNTTAIHESESTQMPSQMPSQIETLEEDESDDDFDWALSPPPRSISGDSTPRLSSTPARPSILRPSSTPRPSLTPRPSSTPGPSLPRRTEKRDLAKVMKQAFEENQSSCEEIATKKVKAERDVGMQRLATERDIGMERIASEERIARFTIDGQAQQMDRMAQLQQSSLDGQTSQMKLFVEMMKDVLAKSEEQDVIIENQRMSHFMNQSMDERMTEQRIKEQHMKEQHMKEQHMKEQRLKGQHRIKQRNERNVERAVDLTDIPNSGDESDCGAGEGG